MIAARGATHSATWLPHFNPMWKNPCQLPTFSHSVAPEQSGEICAPCHFNVIVEWCLVQVVLMVFMGLNTNLSISGSFLSTKEEERKKTF